MPPYVPPHLRPGYKPVEAPADKPKRRRPHFKSNATGLPTHDLTVKVYNKNNYKTLKSARQIRTMALHSRRKVKSALKKAPKQKRTRAAKSASPPNKRNRKTQKAKSR